MCERVASEAAPRRRRHRTGRAQLGQHPVVLRRIDDHGDVRMVLRRGAHHRRPTDIDQLDARGGRERIEVDDRQRNRLDAELLELGDVLGGGEIGEQAGVDHRMQRHHTVPEDRRVAGQFGDVGHRDAGGGDRRRRASTRNETPAQFVQAGGKLGDAGLVVH